MVSFIKAGHGGKKVHETGHGEMRYCSKESDSRVMVGRMRTHAGRHLLPDEAENKMATSQLHPPEGWLHMDVVEDEKMKWMTEPSPGSQTRPELTWFETRFSLDGLVISRTTNVPSHMGLHHHGDEPEASLYQYL